MKSTTIPKTAEELMEFLEHHNLQALVTNFEMTSSPLNAFGFPPIVKITVEMDCHSKETDSKEETLVLNETDNFDDAEKVME